MKFGKIYFIFRKLFSLGLKAFLEKKMHTFVK